MNSNSLKRLSTTSTKIIEFVPDTKVVWHVLDNYFNFTEDKTEWIGTDVVFEIARKGDKTEVHFTHVGLVPAYECYDVCSNAWGFYIKLIRLNYQRQRGAQPGGKRDRGKGFSILKREFT